MLYIFVMSSIFRSGCQSLDLGTAVSAPTSGSGNAATADNHPNALRSLFPWRHLLLLLPISADPDLLPLAPVSARHDHPTVANPSACSRVGCRSAAVGDFGACAAAIQSCKPDGTSCGWRWVISDQGQGLS